MAGQSPKRWLSVVAVSPSMRVRRWLSTVEEDTPGHDSGQPRWPVTIQTVSNPSKRPSQRLLLLERSPVTARGPSWGYLPPGSTDRSNGFSLSRQHCSQVFFWPNCNGSCQDFEVSKRGWKSTVKLRNSLFGGFHRISLISEVAAHGRTAIHSATRKRKRYGAICSLLPRDHSPSRAREFFRSHTGGFRSIRIVRRLNIILGPGQNNRTCRQSRDSDDSCQKNVCWLHANSSMMRPLRPQRSYITTLRHRQVDAQLSRAAEPHRSPHLLTTSPFGRNQTQRCSGALCLIIFDNERRLYALSPVPAAHPGRPGQS